MAVVVFILTFGLFGTAAQAATGNNIQVTVDGKAIVFADAKPFIDEEYLTNVPMRALGEALGCSVKYEKDSYGNISVILSKQTKSGLDIKLEYWGVDPYDRCGYNKYIEGIDFEWEDGNAIKIKSNRTYLPARLIAENFGYNVEWNAAANTVVIKTNPKDLLFNSVVNSVSAEDMYGKWDVVSIYSGKTFGHIDFIEPNQIKMYDVSDGYTGEFNGIFKVKTKNLITYDNRYYDDEVELPIVLIDKNTALISCDPYAGDELIVGKLTRVIN